MECSKAMDLMSEYVDGILEDNDAQEFQEHLKTCENCRDEYNMLKSIVDDCHQLIDIDLPDDFHQKLHDRLEAEAGRSKKRIFKKHYSVAAAAIILAVSISMAMNSGIINFRIKNQASSTAKDMYIQSAKAPTAGGAQSKAENETDESINNPSLKMAVPETAMRASQDNGEMNNASNAAPETYGIQMYEDSLEDEASVTVINVNLEAEEYDKFYKQIISDIGVLKGVSDIEESVEYTIPKENMDSFVQKLTGEYKIDDVSISQRDIEESQRNMTGESSDSETEVKGKASYIIVVLNRK
ncbi:anti-sigma-W factor RsiW [Oxobacter pfennigii]|uniref:Anti-sigma-W factor RsiW n=1 Tax=Oxobacter pfennigii TaxID=36849 RepID=A0A0P8WJD2_9CLOT|nr:zf-HC2 domain-containing protein [Oxobacter pfennigii]KPU42257.1 anti-sigma-W factor RsiW [Oxobacter pfennigii]